MVTLVTGGATPLGRRLVEALASRGDTLRVLVEPGINARLPDGVQVAVGDVRDAEDSVAAMDGARRVYHLSYLMPASSTATPDMFRTVNVDGTRRVLQAARITGVDRIVCCLGIAALGPTGEQIQDEDSSAGRARGTSQQPICACLDSLREADKIARSFHSSPQEGQPGLEVLRVYPGHLYGPARFAARTPLTATIDRLARGGRPLLLASGDHRLTTAFLDDITFGLVLAMENGTAGDGYILGGEELNYRELAEILQDILDRDIRPRFAPRPLRNALVSVRDLLSRLVPSRIKKPSCHCPDIGDHRWRFSSQKAIAELGYKRTPIKEGLRQTLEWLEHCPHDPHRRS